MAFLRSSLCEKWWNQPKKEPRVVKVKIFGLKERSPPKKVWKEARVREEVKRIERGEGLERR